MLELILGAAVIFAVAVCGLLYSRLRRERATIFSLQASAAELGARARFLSDQSSQGIVAFDARGLIRRVNPAAEKMSGYREKELLGQSFLRLVPRVRPEEEERQRSAARTARAYAAASLRPALDPRRRPTSIFFSTPRNLSSSLRRNRSRKQKQEVRMAGGPSRASSRISPSKPNPPCLGRWKMW
jgi:PAS domain-containing protein